MLTSDQRTNPVAGMHKDEIVQSIETADERMLRILRNQLVAYGFDEAGVFVSRVDERIADPVNRGN